MDKYDIILNIMSKVLYLLSIIYFIDKQFECFTVLICLAIVCDYVTLFKTK